MYRKSRKYFFFVSTLFLSGIFSAGWALYTPPQLRTVLNLNKTWKFVKQDIAVDQATASSDPANWSNINLPHSFDIPYWRACYATGPYIGWYRKHLTVDQEWLTSKKRINIEFEAAFLVAQVYVNGVLAGTHAGGYTGFSYDITSLVHAGDNVIAVRLDATQNPQVAPRSGEHIFIGGIYRNVHLVLTDPLHVTWFGTFVTTPQVSSSSATVKVKTEIKNDASTAKTCMVRSIIVDSTGTEVTRIESTKSVASGALDTFVQVSGPITPHLWSPTTPYMYKVYTEVYDGSSPVDNFESPLGIRSVRWDKDNGFFLNGQHLWLQGANAHQDHAGWGDATTNSGPQRDVRLIKECGMNFIRGSHYPHHTAFSDACDKYGICLWEEMCYWGLGGGNNTPNTWKASAYPPNQADWVPFEQNVIQQLKEMIRIHRNHPSIIIWSMCNEVWFSDAAVMTRAKNLITQMVAVAHQEDSTRCAGAGGVQRENTDILSDVAGYNGDGATLFINPNVPNVVAEYGYPSTCYSIRPGEYIGSWGDVQVQNDRPVQYPWRAGIALWCAFHHGSNVDSTQGAGAWGIGKTGMIDHARLPLRRWYYYRNIYRGIAPPTWSVAGTAAKLKLTTDADTINDDGTSDCQLIVQVQNAAGAWLSNSPEITFTDKSGLGIFPSTPTGSPTITFSAGGFEKGVLDGMAAIEYRSYKAGTAIIEATSNGLTPATVEITVRHVPDPVITASHVPKISKIAGGPQEVVIAGNGNRIALPRSMAGKKIVVSLFDMRGRLIGEVPPSRAHVIVRRNTAQGIVIAKAKVVK
jgi:beta-galactosidase